MTTPTRRLFRRHAVLVWMVVLVLIFAGAFAWQENEMRHRDCELSAQRWIVASTIIDQLTTKPGTNGLPARPPTTDPDILAAQRATDQRADTNRALFYEKLGARPSC